MPTPDALRIVRYNADGLRWCDTCRCYMSPELFHRNRASTAGDGMHRYCKVCSRAVRRDYYQRHRERLVAVSLAYQRQQATDASPEQRARLQTQRRLARRVYALGKRLAAEQAEMEIA